MQESFRADTKRTRRMPRRVGGWSLLLAALLSCSIAGSMTRAATSSTTVSATVPTSTSIDMSACPAAALQLPVATVSSSQVTGPCRVGFASNASARLVLHQLDPTGPAMQMVDGIWNRRRGGGTFPAAAIGSSTHMWVGVTPGVGSTDRLLHSSDGGSTWSAQTPCGASGVLELHAFDASTALAGTGGGVCRTTDGGATWTTVLSGAGSVRELDMVDAVNGWVLTSTGQVLRTSDAGATWVAQGSVSGASTWADLSAVSASVAYVNGTRYVTSTHRELVVTRTGDGGATWTAPTTYQTFIPGLGAGSVSIQATAATDVLVSGSGGTWRSTDSGSTWTQVSTRLAREFARISATEYVAGIDLDRYMRTTDAGATWSAAVELGTGSAGYVQDIAVRGSEMLVVGQRELAARSSDGGATFAFPFPARSDLRAIVAWNADRWVAAGTHGTAFTTTDSGVTLTKSTIAGGQHIEDGIAVRDGVGVLVGAAGTILRTSDHGASWTSIANPVASSYAHVVLDEGVLWAATSGSQVVRSVDEGLTWTLVTSPGSNVTSLAARGGVAWIGSTNGRVYRSSDGGASWTSVPTAALGQITAIWPLDTTRVFASARGYEEPDFLAKMLRTSDAGATWSSQVVMPTLLSGRIAELAFSVDGQRGIGISGTYSGYIQTVDGGATWTDRQSQTASTEQLVRLSPGRSVIVGLAESIVVTTPAATVPDGIPVSGAGFGACLEAAVGASTVTWNEVGAGNCSTADSTRWQAVARTASGPTARIAGVTAGGAATVDVRFGVRFGAAQPAGSYAAEVGFTVIAPDT